MFRSKADERFDTRQSEFLSRMLQVRVDGADAEFKLFCDQPRFGPRAEQFETIAFALCQQGEIGWYPDSERADRHFGRIEWP